MTKRRGQSNYYTGRGGGRDADLLRMLNARLATMSSARRALTQRLPLGRFTVTPEQQTIARAEPRPARVTPRMSIERRVAHYGGGPLTGAQFKRVCHKARLDVESRRALAQTVGQARKAPAGI